MGKTGTKAKDHEALYSASQVAQMLRLSGARVRALAASRGVGRHVGHQWVFTAADVEAMRDRTPGRPRSVTGGEGEA